MAASTTLASKVARIEVERASWRQTLAQSNSIAQQVREFTQVGSAVAQIARDLKVLQPAVLTIGQQYKELIGERSAAMHAIRQWHESQRTQQESIRKMLEPIADLRKSLLLDSSTQDLIKELAKGNSIRHQFKDILDQAAGIGSAAKHWAQQREDVRTQTRKIVEDLQVGSSIRSYLKDFEKINKRWVVPSEVFGVVGALRELQEHLGKVALPTIDWGSAAVLAKLLGQDGIRDQLSHLGIESDGSLNPERIQGQEKGILSRKQQDLTSLIGLLLTILIFAYQEYSSAQQQSKTEAFQAQTIAALQVQLQQIQSLNTLIEEALVQAATEPEERFVVRERTAAVRSKPAHGAAVEGRLLPSEVVRAIDRQGKWVEVEYYHWLHEEYRTGWVLKKYLERVPASYGNKPRDFRDGSQQPLTVGS
ncbi:SH3 domain-containing protein [Cupriavidus sp. PET2-C1]